MRLKRSDMKAKRIFLLIVPILLILGCKSAASPKRAINDAGMMYAMLYDYENSPISGASIYINGKKLIESDAQGRFILEFKTGGEYSIRAEKSGYETVEDVFTYDPMNVLYFRMINAPQLMVKAEAALEQYAYAEAEELVNRALKLESGKPEILFLQSIVFYKQGRKAEARAILLDLHGRFLNGDYITDFLTMVSQIP